MNDRTDRGPIRLFNIITAIHHSLVSFANKVHLAAQVNTHSHHWPHGGIHTLRVAAACKHGQTLALVGTSFDEPLSSCLVHLWGLQGFPTPKGYNKQTITDDKSRNTKSSVHNKDVTKWNHYNMLLLNKYVSTHQNKFQNLFRNLNLNFTKVTFDMSILFLNVPTKAKGWSRVIQFVNSKAFIFFFLISK